MSWVVDRVSSPSFVVMVKLSRLPIAVAVSFRFSMDSSMFLAVFGSVSWSPVSVVPFLVKMKEFLMSGYALLISAIALFRAIAQGSLFIVCHFLPDLADLEQYSFGNPVVFQHYVFESFGVAYLVYPV